MKISYQKKLVQIYISDQNNFCKEFFFQMSYEFPFIKIFYRGVSVKGILRDQNLLNLSKFMKRSKFIKNNKNLLCPMPGKLIELFVKVGDMVDVGEKLCIVEAMKMENILVSPKKGKVKNIFFNINDLLKVDDTIIEF